MTVETETAKTSFDMIKFLRALKQDVQPVIQARTQPERLGSIYRHAAMLSAFGSYPCSCDCQHCSLQSMLQAASFHGVKLFLFM